MPNQFKQCPFCGEDILLVAKKCKHCLSEIPDIDRILEQKSKLLQKKVFIQVGFTESGREKNRKSAIKKWTNQGWSIKKIYDGGLKEASYLILEKDEITIQHNKPTSNQIIYYLAIPIFFLMILIVLITMGTDDKVDKSLQNQKKLYQSNSSLNDEETFDVKSQFVFTASTFVDNYKKASHNIEFILKPTFKDVEDNGDFLLTSFMANENIGLIITSNNKTDKVQSITLIGTGDGSTQSGVDIILASLALVMAIEDTEMLIHERSKILKQFGLFDKNLGGGEKWELIRKRIRYSFSFSDDSGLMVIAEPIRN